MLKAAPRRASVGTAGLPVLAAALSVLWGSVAGPSARADSAPAGLTVQFPAVITTDTAARLRAAVYAPQKRYEAERQRDGDKSGPFKLLCDFNPDGRPNATDDFGACSDLAEVIRDLQEKGVQTRAYVHGEVSRQAVLPVLACGEIVLSADPPARFGRIVDPDRTLSPFERPAYEAMTKGRFPLALVRKMYDRDLAVVQVFPAPKNGDRYLGAREAADARLNAQPVADLGPGAAGVLRLRPGQGTGPLPSRRGKHPGGRPGRFQAAAVQHLPAPGPHYGRPGGGPRRSERPAQGGRGAPAQSGAWRQGQRPHSAAGVRRRGRRRRPNRLRPGPVHRRPQGPRRQAAQDHRLRHAVVAGRGRVPGAWPATRS